MSSSLLPSTMAAAVHQQSLIASTAAAVAASDFAVSFASQLAAAAAVVGGVATSTIRTDSSASAVTVDSSASTTTNCDMQHLDRSSSINNSIVDSGNGCPMEVDQPVGRTPLVSTISPSLIGINRSSLDDISAGSHHHHSQHQSRAVAAAMLGAKCVSLSKAFGQNKIKITQAMRAQLPSFACDSLLSFFFQNY